jgi:starch phosphorylase
MSFQIRPLKEFLVRPALPEPLKRIAELAPNLVWSWDHPLRSLFRRLDPAEWKEANHNPIVMLGHVDQSTLERAATDPRYLALYRRAMESFDAYMAASREKKSGMLVAYFSMEYGLLDCMPIYSGGLGVLSGDHLKASSDAMLPLVGVGLLYQKGYFRQSLDPDGWQQERTPVNDFYSLPVTPLTRNDGSEMLVTIRVGPADVTLKVWCLDVGRVKLYLLDTNIPQKPRPGASRDHQSALRRRSAYAHPPGNRAGNRRAASLKELGIAPTVYHMNEGHSAFLAVERIRVLMSEEGLSFQEALEASRTNNVFTTHTSVPAGIDLFEVGLMHEYFSDYCQEAGIDFEQFVALGRDGTAEPQEPFSMAIAAIQTSSFRNAVSRLHRRVSQQMWEALWPKLPVWEVPITSITNGVHLPSWINGDLAGLYDQYLRPDWREGHADPKVWEQIADIPDVELWDAHRRRRRRLIAFVRERVLASALARNAPAPEVKRLQEVLDPETFTIGFARRFATYKRATLFFRDRERLKRLLTNPRMPVQIVIAGKAHPSDVPGKALIREIVQYSRDPEMAGHIIFVEDYGIQVAREMVQGVDVWLNNPKRGEEACGTSGMKAGLNGVLNMSILDGWFDEAAEESGGWAIGDREPYSPDKDDAHAAGIYSLLENEVVPLFYQGREQGVPTQWVRRVKQSLQYLSANFNCQRMVGEYLSQLYEPAHRSFEAVKRDHFASSRDHVRWTAEVYEKWPAVKFVSSGIGSEHVVAGSALPLRAEVELAGLKPQDVRVEAVVGRVAADGEIEEAQVLTLAPLEQHETAYLFGRDFAPFTTGRLGYALRVTPNHYEDPLNRPCNSLLKWAGDPD